MIQQASRLSPVCYVLFDVLTARGRCLLGEPLASRRACLAELLEQASPPWLAYSEGIVGAGRAFYERAASVAAAQPRKARPRRPSCAMPTRCSP